MVCCPVCVWGHRLWYRFLLDAPTLASPLRRALALLLRPVSNLANISKSFDYNLTRRVVKIDLSEPLITSQCRNLEYERSVSSSETDDKHMTLLQIFILALDHKPVGQVGITSRTTKVLSRKPQSILAVANSCQLPNQQQRKQ